jgi:class 3 adenylate cyclase
MPLPAPLLAAYDAVFGSLLEPGEPLLSVMRKLMVTIAFLGFVPMACVFGAYMSYRAATDTYIATSPGTYVLITVFALGGAFFGATYVVLRRARRLPDWLMDVWLGMIDLFVPALMVSVPAFPIYMCCVAGVIMNVLLQTPAMPLHVALNAAAFLVHAYNEAYDDVVALPQPYPATRVERLLLGVIGFCIAAMMMGAVYGMSREFHRVYDAQQRQLADETRDTEHAPTAGTIAVIFTDIEDSTKLWGNAPLSMGVALDTHHRVIRECIVRHRAFEVKTAGDSFMIAVGDAARAMQLVLDIQLELMRVPFPAAIAAVYAAEFDGEIDAIDDAPETLAKPTGAWNGPRVRIGVHCGPVNVVFDEVTKGYDYYGPDVNIAARVEAVALGGQICCTRTFIQALPGGAPDYMTESLGMRDLKGVPMAVEVFAATPVSLLEARKYASAEPTSLRRALSKLTAGSSSSVSSPPSSDAGDDDDGTQPEYAAFVTALFSAFRRTDDRNTAVGLILGAWRVQRSHGAALESTYADIARRVAAVAGRKQRRRASCAFSADRSHASGRSSRATSAVGGPLSAHNPGEVPDDE